jgi:hypothetical protein
MAVKPIPERTDFDGDLARRSVSPCALFYQHCLAPKQQIDGAIAKSGFQTNVGTSKADDALLP